VRRPSRRVSKMLLSLGITAIVLAIALVAASRLIGSPVLRSAAVVYILLAVAVLCYREVRKRTYQIKKRRISRH
jgi:hypothetical protein